jgi:hypothetical protein
MDVSMNSSAHRIPIRCVSARREGPTLVEGMRKEGAKIFVEQVFSVSHSDQFPPVTAVKFY